MEVTTFPLLRECRILILEDDRLVAEELAKAVRLFGGIALGPLNTSQEALAHVEQAPVMLAIVGHDRRGELPCPLVDNLMARKVPTVVVTEHGGRLIPPQYRHLPRWEKPLVPVALVAALRPGRAVGQVDWLGRAWPRRPRPQEIVGARRAATVRQRAGDDAVTVLGAD